MARKEVVEYFLQQKKVMYDTVEVSKQFDLLFKQGKVTEEQRDQAMREVDIVKANYMRLAYIMFLLNKPKRKDKQKTEERQNASWYEALSGASKEALLDESKDALADFKKMMEQAK